jgi:hypothetical protein
MRERRDEVVPDGAEVRDLEHPGQALGYRGAAHAAQAPGELEVLADRHVHVKGWVLGQEADVLPDLVRIGDTAFVLPTSTEPPLGLRSQAKILRAVVLPAPFRPRKPTASPSAISKLTGPRARLAP